MPFGMEGAPQLHWSKENLKLAVAKLSEEPPTFGEGGNTGERDSKYYAMGYEMEKTEYDHFLEQLNELLKLHNEDKENELRKAA